ncbi:Clathrin light chain A, partial [Eschrichtius robustus]|nr:Clathrin light chain A [Eschrichtius robustus]
MAELDPFGAHASGPALGNGVAGEEDPAAAFLAQQESEIAGIENDEAFAILDGGAPGPQPHGEPPGGPDAVDGIMNGEYYQESNGPTDSYAAISQVDRLQSEPESIRKWREEQTERLEALGRCVGIRAARRATVHLSSQEGQSRAVERALDLE